MNYPKQSLALAICLLVPTFAFAAAPPKPVVPKPAPKPGKAPSAGEFTDSAGKKHPWTVNEAHALIWDGAPYIPVGGMFCPKYLVSGQTDANWAEDMKGLDLLKSHGIDDLYINPVRGATTYPPEAWQKLIDALDERGFHYGIELTDGPKDALKGYVVKPQLTKVRENSTFAARYPAAETATYAVVDAENSVVETATLKLTDGDMILRIPAGGRKMAVITNGPVPAETGMQDYWDGYADYRDRLLALFAKIKLGPGFRFFVDPFVNEMGLCGEASMVVPDSPGYRMELEVGLQRKYPEIADLAEKWVPDDTPPKTFEAAARLVPLQQGAGYAWDSQTGKLVHCTAQVWKDQSDFRDRAIRNYMNLASDLLKDKVANVPVIFKWTETNRIFTNTDERGGFDGLGIEAYASAESLADGAAIPCFAQAEGAARTQWLVVTETQDTASPQKPDLGYPSQLKMHADLDWLRLAGAKGFFVFGFQLLPQPTWNNFELLRDARQLDWLSAYRIKLAAIPDLAAETPKVLYYPTNIETSARVRMLATGVWWAPSQRKGESLGLPGGLDGYYFKDEDNPTCAVWADEGTRSITLTIPRTVPVELLSSDGKPIKIKPDKKQRVVLPLTQDPILIRGIPPLAIFPPEATMKALDEFKKLIAEGDKRKINMGYYKQILSNAQIVYSNVMARVAYNTLRVPMENLRRLLAPYIWVEGEEAAEHTLSGIVSSGGCSGGAYLRLFESADPTGSYRARFVVDAKSDGRHEFWLAGTPPGLDWVSPATYSIDSGEPKELKAEPLKGSQYNRDFYWSKIGMVDLTKGIHTLDIKVTGRRKTPDTNYVLYIDALVLSPTPFKPNGIKKP